MAVETEFPDKARAVTPSNAARFGTRSTVYVGGAGNVAVIPFGVEKDSDSVVFAMAAGSIVPVQVRAVLATGTTATNLVRVF
jgi:hypothetical protein